MKNDLFLAIDPGFDSVKVIANGINFKFPFNAVETDERKMSDYGSREGFILYKDQSGATWRVGAYARDLAYENKMHDISDFYSEQRFVSGEFSVGIRSAIALAIDKAQLYEVQNDLDIHIIVALPHAIRTKYASTIVGLVAGEHEYFMTFGGQKERPYHFTIADTSVLTVSQTIAAILGETSDDDGNINEEKYFYLRNGPTLVIDGGYYTTGLVPVSRGGSVDDSKAESDTDHAMKNVNLAVAESVKQYRPDFEHYMVEYLSTQPPEENTIRYMKDGKVQTVDLTSIRKKMMRKVCDDFIHHLDLKYNSLLDFRYVLVTGGTGANFYDQLLAHYKEIGLMDETHILLTRPSVCGNELPIEYAIAVGAYKGLRGKVG